MPRLQVMRCRAALLVLGCTLALTSCAVQTPGPRFGAQPLSTVRGAHLQGALVELATQRVVPLETCIAALARTQVVALGEVHYHPAVQAFELRVLQTLVQQQPQPIILAMEFLERDMQPSVDAYLAGHIDAATLYGHIKATPAFIQSYMPLLQYARQAGIPVRAMNAPRALARRVAKEGLHAVLDSLTSAERASLAATMAPMTPEYRAYSVQALAEAHPLPPDQTERFVEAAYVKDETMAESLATIVAAAPTATVLAIAGRFHVDYGLAIPALLKQRRPDVTMVRVTTIPVAADEDTDVRRLAKAGLAEYVWFAAPHAASPAGNSGGRAMQTSEEVRGGSVAAPSVVPLR